MRVKLLGWLCIVWAGPQFAQAQFDPPSPGLDPGQLLNPAPFSPPAPGILPGEPGYYGPDADALGNSSAEPLPYPPAENGVPRRRFRRLAAPELVLNEPAFPKVWFGAEALYWWTKSSPVPPPVLTVGDPADSTPGAIGQPGTTVLLGNQNIGIPGRGGNRFKFGFSFGAEQDWAFEAAYFYLVSAQMGYEVDSSGSRHSALLAFPFYNPLIPGEDASPVSLPGSFAGSATLTITDFVQGADFNIFRNLRNAEGIRFDVLGGFRYFNLAENLNFSTDSPNVYPNPAGYFHTYDEFDAQNNFYGAQAGLRVSYDTARFYMNALAKLALGDTVQTVTVNGGTVTNIGGYASAPGAYLSEPTNLGRATRNQFAVVPEMNFNFGLRLRPWVSVMAGYSFLYVSSVARPGNQLDRVINPSQSPGINSNFSGTLNGVARPELNIHPSDFWVQGLNFALELRF